MADKFSKQSIYNVLKAKVQAKGFDLNPDTSDMSQGIKTIDDMILVIAESLEEVLKNDQTKSGTIKAKKLLLVPTGAKDAAYKNGKIAFNATTDPAFFAWMETLHALIAIVYPEPGYGAPDIFATALKLLLTQKPTSLTGRITDGSKTVKVGA